MPGLTKCILVGWVMGVEPTTPGTTIRCSAIELHPPQYLNYLSIGVINMARQKGFEPLTRSLEGCCSILLSYWRLFDGSGAGI